MTRLDARLMAYKKLVAEGYVDFSEEVQIFEALKAARDALETCRVHEQGQRYNSFAVSAAILKIDALWEK